MFYPTKIYIDQIFSHKFTIDMDIWMIQARPMIINYHFISLFGVFNSDGCMPIHIYQSEHQPYLSFRMVEIYNQYITLINHVNLIYDLNFFFYIYNLNKNHIIPYVPTFFVSLIVIGLLIQQFLAFFFLFFFISSSFYPQ